MSTERRKELKRRRHRKKKNRKARIREMIRTKGKKREETGSGA
jgi:hypothetical protein